MRLRQIVLAVKDLAAARADVAAVLGLPYAYEDPGVAKYGLVNAVFPIGDTFLELVSPNIPGTAAGRFLEKRGGDGGYMLIVQVDDIAEARSRVRDAQVRIVDQMDGNGVAFTHLHPKDVGGAILSLDYMDPKERWDWGGPDWRSKASSKDSLKIVAAELHADHPEQMAARWTTVLGQRAEESDDGVWRIPLAGGEFRFGFASQGQGDGFATFDVMVRDIKSVRTRAAELGLLSAEGMITLAGTSVRLIEHEELINLPIVSATIVSIAGTNDESAM